mmetsp:Transcript_21982/g.52809  ORF Transcript_21982/g.52809 Transcript_21982/m.52809 type:complete len:110 (-) Transcript_21982:39-368(-)
MSRPAGSEWERCAEDMPLLSMTGSERVRVWASSLPRENVSNVATGSEEGSSSAAAFGGFVFRQAMLGNMVPTHKKGFSSGLNPECPLSRREPAELGRLGRWDWSIACIS